MTLTVPRFAARTGRRLFVPVNILRRWTNVPPATEKRTQAIEFFPDAFTYADTIRFELPAGFTVEALPEPIQVETPFLRYAARAEAPGRHLRLRALDRYGGNVTEAAKALGVSRSALYRRIQRYGL